MKMPSLKRRHSERKNLVTHPNNNMRTVKKMRMCQDDCDTKKNSKKPARLSDCTISNLGIHSSKIVFHKFHRRKRINVFKKLNIDKSTASYDSIGSVWKVIDIDNFQYENMKNSSSEFNACELNVSERVKTSEIFRTHADNENSYREKLKKSECIHLNNVSDQKKGLKRRRKCSMDQIFEEENTILKSRSSVLYSKKKEIIKSMDIFEGTENTDVSKTVKKQRLKHNVIQPEECSASGMNIPSVFKVKKSNISDEHELRKKEQRENKLGRINNRTKLSVEKENKDEEGKIKEGEKVPEEENLMYTNINSLDQQIENEVDICMNQINEMNEDSERVIVEGGNEIGKKKQRKTNLVRLKKEEIRVNCEGAKVKKKKLIENLERKIVGQIVGNEKKHSEQIECSKNVINTCLGVEDADNNGNDNVQSKEDETIVRIKRKVSKLLIESEDENEEAKIKHGNKKREKFVNSDTVRYSFIESDSEEDEEVNDFIVDDDYISYDEDATSDDEYEYTNYNGDSNDDDADDDDDDNGGSGSDEEECLPLKRKRGRISNQFLDMEAEEGEETEVEDEDEEEEETSDDDDDDDDDSIVGVEQLIDNEAREEVTFVRRKKKVQVIDSEEEEEEAEKKELAETGRLEKTVHIMKKLTRIMTAGHLKGKALRKHVDVNKVSKETEEYEKNGSEMRNRKIMCDGKHEYQITEELQIQQKVGEEMREILGEDKFGKKKQRKSATDLGRGYSSDPEYVEPRKPKMASIKFMP